MGMYDDIEISKSYTRNLLTKKQEKILNLCKSNDYQTKSLDNALLKFSFYRSKLYKSEWDDKNKKFTKRKPVKFTGVVNAYKVIKKDDKDYWVELDFTVKDGVLDAKEVSFIFIISIPICSSSVLVDRQELLLFFIFSSNNPTKMARTRVMTTTIP